MILSADVEHFEFGQSYFVNVRLNGKRCRPVTTCETSRQVFYCGKYVVKLDKPYNDHMVQNPDELEAYNHIPVSMKKYFPRLVHSGDVICDEDVGNPMFLVFERIRGRNLSAFPSRKWIKLLERRTKLEDFGDLEEYFSRYFEQNGTEDDCEFYENFCRKDIHDDNVMLTKDGFKIVDLGYYW